MTRDQLEAAIWQHAPLLTSTDPQDRQDGMTGILTAADAYAAAEVGLLTPAERRHAIAGGPSRRALMDTIMGAVDDYAADQSARAVAGPLP